VGKKQKTKSTIKVQWSTEAMVIDVIDVKPERTLPKAPDLIAEALYLEKKCRFLFTSMEQRK